MKGALRILRYDARYNGWLLLASYLIAAIGAYMDLDTPVFPAMAAAAIGVLSSGAAVGLERGGSWEMQVMTMPVSRKALVVGRYVKALVFDLLLGAVYMAAFRVFHGRSDDGMTLLLAGYALAATACSLPVCYTSWASETKMRRYTMCMSVFIIFSRTAVRRDYEAVRTPAGYTAVALPIAMEKGMGWLIGGLAAMAVSLILSLWLEPKREW